MAQGPGSFPSHAVTLVPWLPSKYPRVPSGPCTQPGSQGCLEGAYLDKQPQHEKQYQVHGPERAAGRVPPDVQGTY